MTNILLTGAGFTRNWGGFLASEVFNLLLNRPEIDGPVRDRLWRAQRNRGSFEDALAELQTEFATTQNATIETQLKNLEAALIGMFNGLTQTLTLTPFEPQTDIQFQFTTWLSRFDALFTLNQDLLVELHYLNEGIALRNSRRWDGCHIPGVKPLNPNPVYFDPILTKTSLKVPDANLMVDHPRMQPYFKLHGSANWMTDAGGRLMIMGGNKATTIGQVPLLKWYYEKFEEYLSRPNARLIVAGYGFGDHHINQAILRASERGTGFQLFIIDPAGVSVLDKTDPRALIPDRPGPLDVLRPHVRGVSSRTLSTTFNTDRFEHGNVMSFLGAG